MPGWPRHLRGRRRAALVRPLGGLVAVGLLATACGFGQLHDPQAQIRQAQKDSAPIVALDGLGLPVPVSALGSSGGLVLYFAPAKGGRLELVAIDPATAKVRWRVPAAVDEHPPGVQISILVRDGLVFHYRPYEVAGDSRFQLVARDALTGREQWSAGAGTPTDAPRACGPDVCVPTVFDAQGHAANIVYSAKTGALITVHRVALGPEVAADDNGAALIVESDRDNSVPARTATGTLNWGGVTVWQRPVADLFGGTSVNPWAGWSGVRTTAGWMLYLAHTTQPGIGVTPPGVAIDPGTLAGIGPDGRSLWVLPNTSICVSIPAPQALLRCNGTTTIVDDHYTQPVVSIDGIAPATGATAFHVALTTPIDNYAPGDRVIQLDPTRFVVTTGTGMTLIDTTKVTAKAIGSGTPTLESPQNRFGWCSQPSSPVTLASPSGRFLEYRVARTAIPCAASGDRLTNADVVHQAVAGRLQFLTGAPSVTKANTWWVWVQDGTLRGVQVPA